ncbi:hypothetical protein [Saccharomonospora halophila]|uniref:hypothetical protein n=1 Tax=Saccharomonospora halophila TaxID=129922 RepID=UPI00036F2E7A|nr:hypothetical protein [Saccharomonospora halophila]
MSLARAGDIRGVTVVLDRAVGAYWLYGALKRDGRAALGVATAGVLVGLLAIEAV